MPALGCCIKDPHLNSTIDILLCETGGFVCSPWFRFDPLGHYSNEQSLVLARLRKTVESAWQAWEARQPETSPETFRTLSSDQVRGIVMQ